MPSERASAAFSCSISARRSASDAEATGGKGDGKGFSPGISLFA